MLHVNKVVQMDCLEGMSGLTNQVDLILSSPPYNIGKSYEKKENLSFYLKWQQELIKRYYEVLKPNGSIAYQVGNFVDKGKVYPLDCLLFSYFIEAGFIPRNRIVWTFGHGMHCTKRLSGRHETLLWFTKSDDYTFDLDAIRVPQKYPGKKHFKGDKKGELSGNPLGKNPGDVWDITNVKSNHPEKTNHPCQFPLDLARKSIKAWSNPDDLVLDPFCGSGTSLVAAKELSRRFTGYELLTEYVDIANKRLNDV
jgi:adenine-specific DNA-methyltransferase